MPLKDINKLIRNQYLDKLTVQNGVLFLKEDAILLKTVMDLEDDIVIATATLV